MDQVGPRSPKAIGNGCLPVKKSADFSETLLDHRVFIQFWYYFWQIGDTVSYAGSDIEYFLRTGSYS